MSDVVAWCLHLQGRGVYLCRAGVRESGLANGWTPQPMPAAGEMLLNCLEVCMCRCAGDAQRLASAIVSR
jgi:hypothetical protein